MAIDLGGQKVSKDIPQQKDFEIAEGNYLIKPDVVEPRKRQDTGDPIIRCELEILDADNKDNVKFIGMKFYEVFSLSDDAMWRIAAFLRAAYNDPDLECSKIPDDVFKKKIVVRARKNYDPKNERWRVQCQRFDPAVDWSGVTITIKAGEEDKEKSSKNDDEDVDL